MMSFFMTLHEATHRVSFVSLKIWLLFLVGEDGSFPGAIQHFHPLLDRKDGYFTLFTLAYSGLVNFHWQQSPKTVKVNFAPKKNINIGPEQTFPR